MEESNNRRSWNRRAVALLFRRPKTAVFLIALLFVLGPYFFSRVCAPWNRLKLIENVEVVKPVAGTDSVESESFSICCFNIAHGRGPTDDNWEESANQKPIRVADIAKFLKRLNADIVVLNEVDFQSTWSSNQNQATEIAKSAGYRFCVQQRNLDFRVAHYNWRFGNAILSKYPVSNIEVIAYPPERSWENWLVGCKRGVVCEVEIQKSFSIRVAGVHLEHRSESVRLPSATMITDLAGNGPPLIAAGDFNSTPTGFPHSQETESGENTMDSLFKSGLFINSPAELPDASDFTFSTYDPKSVIDWILIPRGIANPIEFSFTDYQSIATDLSDHRAVLATIRRQPAKPNLHSQPNDR